MEKVWGDREKERERVESSEGGSDFKEESLDAIWRRDMERKVWRFECLWQGRMGFMKVAGIQNSQMHV